MKITKLKETITKITEPLGYNVVLNTFRKYVTMYIQILIMANSP